MSRRTLIVVNYHAAVLAGEAIASARAASSAPLEVVVVDNSVSEAEVGRLQSLPIDDLVVSPANIGYAGGINRGVEVCSGDTVIIANPDVLFRPAAIDRLVEALSGRIAMTGPRFVWDEDDRWLFPPATETTWKTKLDEIASSRSRKWYAISDRRRVRERVRFWRNGATMIRPVLSGAVMCVRRDTLRAIPFDERYPLYFEEVDYMRRLRRAGGFCAEVPGAVCRHLYARSSSTDGSAAQRYLEAEKIYLDRWEPSLLVDLIRRMPAGEFDPGDWRPLDAREPLRLPEGDDVLVELSPLTSFRTAVGAFFRGGELISLPVDAMKGVPVQLYGRVIRLPDLATLLRFRLEGID